jgi:hypothetical protein
MLAAFLIALLLVIVGAIYLLFRPQPVGDRTTSAKSGANGADKDRKTLSALDVAGSDLTKPHPIEFFLYLPNEEAANSAARELDEAGFEAVVKQDRGESSWLCLATKLIVPSPGAIADERERFERLAAQHRGEYDGWGTPVVR